MESSTWLLLVCLLAVVYYYCISTYRYWRNKGVPYLPPVPLFGNTWKHYLMGLSKAECYQEIYRAMEGHKVAGLFNMRTPVLMLRDPDIIKRVLVKDFRCFQDREEIFSKEGDILFHNLFTAKGETWRYLRTKLTPAFTSSKMKNMMFPKLRSCADELVAYLEKPAANRDILELKDTTSRYTINAIGSCAFGIKCNSFTDKNTTFYTVGKKMFHASTPAFVVHAMKLAVPTLFSLLKLKIIPDDVNDFFINLVKEIIEHRVKKGQVSQAADFIDILIQLRTNRAITKEAEDEQEEDGASSTCDQNIEFTDHLLTAQVFVFFLAGYDTSATVLTMCLLELALHPEIQERVQMEVDAALLTTEGQLTYDLVQGLNYMDMVLSETMRLHPPGNDLMRIAGRDYKIPECGVEVSAGDLLIVPLFSLQRDPQYFPDPERFDPERFTSEVKADRPAFCYLPFGEGPRNCIGSRFAQLQSKIGLASMVSRYKFSISHKTSLPITLDNRAFITTAKGGIYLRITKRHTV